MIVASVARLSSPFSFLPRSDSFKAAARNAFPQLYPPLRDGTPRLRDLSTKVAQPRGKIRVVRRRSFVASLKLCLGLRIAAGRTSGRRRARVGFLMAICELPGRKKEEQRRGRERDCCYEVPA